MRWQMEIFTNNTMKTLMLLAAAALLTSCGYDPSARSTIFDSITFEASHQSDDGSRNSAVKFKPFE
jgi:outer membrane lipopolysaccharide assembly protein LptE/RlpB